MFITGVFIIAFTLLGIFHIIRALWDMDTLYGIIYLVIATLFFVAFGLINT